MGSGLKLYLIYERHGSQRETGDFYSLLSDISVCEVCMDTVSTLKQTVQRGNILCVYLYYMIYINRIE